MLKHPSSNTMPLSEHAVLPSSPSPYEYALISEASYSDVPPAENSLLRAKGWEWIEFINDVPGYCGSLWANHTQKQLVIAHRGSQNLDSWVTDAESVAQLKPGHFVTQAVSVLENTLVLQHKEMGYRLSVTGHSLGG